MSVDNQVIFECPKHGVVQHEQSTENACSKCVDEQIWQLLVIAAHEAVRRGHLTLPTE